jgi:hypothetical protein
MPHLPNRLVLYGHGFSTVKRTSSVPEGESRDGEPSRVRLVPIKPEGIANLSNNRDYNQFVKRVNANRSARLALTS